MCGCLSHTPCWEHVLQPFGLQAGAQSTEPHQPGQKFLVLKESSQHLIKKIKGQITA